MVTFQLVADLSDVSSGAELLATTIGPAGEAVLLHRYRNQARLSAVNESGHELGRLTTLWPEGIEVPIASRFPDGAMLIVGRRCTRMPDGSHSPSAIVYDTDSKIRSEFLLGDGIEDVQMTPDGHIWVSYFDEGVYGNLGSDRSLASSGLVEFDANGQTVWAFTPPEGFDVIDDCYALNAADTDRVYAYYYSSFPIMQIGPNRVPRGWHTSVAGARAFAVDGDRILLFGGYPGDRTRAVIGTLEGESLTRAQVLPTSVAGPDTLESMRIVGRGPVLHGFAGARWYQFDLRSMT